jgi:hypothetical protein
MELKVDQKNFTLGGQWQKIIGPFSWYRKKLQPERLLRPSGQEQDISAHKM